MTYARQTVTWLLLPVEEIIYVIAINIFIIMETQIWFLVMNICCFEETALFEYTEGN